MRLAKNAATVRLECQQVPPTASAGKGEPFTRGYSGTDGEAALSSSAPFSPGLQHGMLTCGLGTLFA